MIPGTVHTAPTSFLSILTHLLNSLCARPSLCTVESLMAMITLTFLANPPPWSKSGLSNALIFSRDLCIDRVLEPKGLTGALGSN